MYPAAEDAQNVRFKLPIAVEIAHISQTSDEAAPCGGRLRGDARGSSSLGSIDSAFEPLCRHRREQTIGNPADEFTTILGAARKGLEMAEANVQRLSRELAGLESEQLALRNLADIAKGACEASDDAMAESVYLYAAKHARYFAELVTLDVSGLFRHTENLELEAKVAGQEADAARRVFEKKRRAAIAAINALEAKQAVIDQHTIALTKASQICLAWEAVVDNNTVAAENDPARSLREEMGAPPAQ